MGWNRAGASSFSAPAPADWESLQLGGMIFGGLLCIAGILIALSEWWGWQAGHGGGYGVAQVPQVLCTDQLFLSQVENANASTIRSTGETGTLSYALGVSGAHLFWGKVLQFREKRQLLGCSLGLQ